MDLADHRLKLWFIHVFDISLENEPSSVSTASYSKSHASTICALFTSFDEILRYNQPCKTRNETPEWQINLVK